MSRIANDYDAYSPQSSIHKHSCSASIATAMSPRRHRRWPLWRLWTVRVSSVNNVIFQSLNQSLTPVVRWSDLCLEPGMQAPGTIPVWFVFWCRSPRSASQETRRCSRETWTFHTTGSHTSSRVRHRSKPRSIARRWAQGRIRFSFTIRFLYKYTRATWILRTCKVGSTCIPVTFGEDNLYLRWKLWASQPVIRSFGILVIVDW